MRFVTGVALAPSRAQDRTGIVHEAGQACPSALDLFPSIFECGILKTLHLPAHVLLQSLS
jgi:hypothetical protein